MSLGSMNFIVLGQIIRSRSLCMYKLGNKNWHIFTFRRQLAKVKFLKWWKAESWESLRTPEQGRRAEVGAQSKTQTSPHGWAKSFTSS